MATARVVATTTIPVKGRVGCPTMYSFAKGKTVAKALGRVGPEYAAFIDKHGGPAAE
ncbi:MAG: hypothetical protein K0V04_40635 [Deltaproteobacteria bacterium]|nr:hypothetical protein [Deltaproteobacteria bacterium]